MINKMIVLGRVGQKKPLTATQGGTPAIKFSVATNDKYKDQEETTWHNVQAYGKLAEIVDQYVDKGSQVYVEGKLSKRQYTDKQGVEKEWIEILAQTVRMVGSKPKSEYQNPQQGYHQPQQPSLDQYAQDGDIPY